MRFRDLRPKKFEHAMHSETGGWQQSVMFMSAIKRQVDLEMQAKYGTPLRKKYLPPMGRWHYIFEKDGMVVSLVQELDDHNTPWRRPSQWSMCPNYNYDKIRIYPTKREAERAIFKMFLNAEKRRKKLEARSR